jgi:riboflavin kinase/FMN adenylyltransferase
VEGPTFTFGYGRSGTIETLRQLAATRDFEVIVSPPRQVVIQGNASVMCSSSLIRNYLHEGKVENASRTLGRLYRLIGQTVPGRGIGRQLGFPTANIDPGTQLVPAEGVYAGFVAAADTLDDVCGPIHPRPAAFSIGRAKTFLSDHPLLVEAHILEKDIEDLTGKWLAMEFVKRIRPQQRFENHNALKDQIEKDCRAAAQILANTPNEG